jgi:hypothetical protein
MHMMVKHKRVILKHAEMHPDFWQCKKQGLVAHCHSNICTGPAKLLFFAVTATAVWHASWLDGQV